jgi:hypothetical protein
VQRGGEPLDRSSGIDRHAQGLIRVDAKLGTDFSEFAAFDLSVDEQSTAVITAVRQGILETDTLTTPLRTVSQLVRLEPNPTLVDAFLRRGARIDARTRAGSAVARLDCRDQGIHHARRRTS